MAARASAAAAAAASLRPEPCRRPRWRKALAPNKHNNAELDELYPAVYDDEKKEYRSKKTGLPIQYRVTSVSSVFFPSTFDQDKIIESMAKRRALTGEAMPSAEALKELWGQKGAEGQDFGSMCHKRIEESILGIRKWRPTEEREKHAHELYKEFTRLATNQGWAPFKVEWTLMIPPIAGRCDCVLARVSEEESTPEILELWVIDWKFCKRMSTAPSAPAALFPFEFYHNTDQNRYALQVNMYSHMIEHGIASRIAWRGKMYSGLHVSRRSLIVMHPERKKLKIVDIDRIPYARLKHVWKLAARNADSPTYPFDRYANRDSSFRRPPS